MGKKKQKPRVRQHMSTLGAKRGLQASASAKDLLKKNEKIARRCHIIQKGHCSVISDYRVAMFAHSPPPIALAFSAAVAS